MSIVKVGWSGGKDSTCAVLLHLENGDKVKACCYVPMFTKEIPLIGKKHYEFILRAAEKFRSMGADVYITSGITYWDWVTKVTTRGKYKGKIFGFPCVHTGKCGFQRDSKTKSITNLDVGDYDYVDIGIAYDEVARKGQLSEDKRSILCEMGYTEKMAWQKCIEYDLLSPHYESASRDGCALCYNARKQERERWFADYPEAVPLVIQLQDMVKEQRPERAPLRGFQYFIETDNPQISFFD